MKTKFTIVLIFTTAVLCAQAPPITWQTSLGGGVFDAAKAVQQTSDGGYVVAGYTSSSDGDVTGNHGGMDYWVVKFDNTGVVLWQKCMGGSGYDYAQSIQQTSDGGYIVAGRSGSNDGDITSHNGNYDYWIVKLDSAGNIVWEKSLGGSDYDQAYSIQQTMDAGYIIAGFSRSNDGMVTGNHGNDDAWIVKLDNAGSITWEKSIGGSGIDEARSVQQTQDGGYIIAGYTGSNDGDVTGNHGQGDFWVIKLDGAGSLIWQHALGGNSADGAYSIQQTIDDGYIVAGYSRSNNGDVTVNNGEADYWIVKLDNTGVIIWEKSLGGSGIDGAYSVKQTSDGGYIVAGISPSNDGDVTNNHGYGDYWVIKLDPNGLLIWQQSYGGSKVDEARAIQQTLDGGYIIAGSSHSDNGDITVHYNSSDYWIVKLEASASDSISDTTTVGIFENETSTSSIFFPNPSSGIITLSNLQEGSGIEIYDLTGRLVYSTIIINRRMPIDLSNQPKGFYLYKVLNYNNLINSQGMLILK